MTRSRFAPPPRPCDEPLPVPADKVDDSDKVENTVKDWP